MKILITGAAGGIGSAVSDALFELGHTLILIDDLSSGKITNLEKPQNQVTLRPVSIRTALRDFQEIFECEVILNFAAVTSLVQCQMNPLRAFETNTLDVINLVDLAKKTGAMFIQASTSAVYENVQQVPFNENLLVNPTLTYPMSKKFAEDYIVSTGITNNLNYHILRFFNVFSPKQDLMRARPPLVNYILREIAYERVPQIFAPLEQRRDYVCVDDVVSLICRLLARSNELSQNHILNVCRGEAISILEIIDSIKIGLGRNFRYELSEPQKLWDDQLSQLDEFYPFNRSLVAKETLKPSLGDPLRALNELGWAAEHDTLNCISENASAIFLRASKYNDCKS